MIKSSCFFFSRVVDYCFQCRLVGAIPFSRLDPHIPIFESEKSFFNFTETVDFERGGIDVHRSAGFKTRAFQC